VHFLQGTAGFRTVPPATRVTDAPAALDYASRCLPDAVKTQAVLGRVAYHAHMEATGEPLPGVAT
jgi:hypothetical protein